MCLIEIAEVDCQRGPVHNPAAIQLVNGMVDNGLVTLRGLDDYSHWPENLLESVILRRGVYTELAVSRRRARGISEAILWTNGVEVRLRMT